MKEKYFLTIGIIILGLIAQKGVNKVLSWYAQKFASKTTAVIDDKLVPLFKHAAKVLIWVIVLMLALPIYGINISALIATLGVGSLAIALAAQDTIANIISGFMIMIDRPFGIGDKIKLSSGELVEVLEIGVRRSKFLAQDKGVVIMPNLELSKSKIINYSYGRDNEV